jgi:hypothetical protein
MDGDRPTTPVPPKAFRREPLLFWSLVAAAVVLGAVVVLFGNGATVAQRALAVVGAAGLAAGFIWIKGGMGERSAASYSCRSGHWCRAICRDE